MKKFFSSISNFFRKLFRRKPKNDWLENYNREVAKPKNPLPLDPDNPWST